MICLFPVKTFGHSNDVTRQADVKDDEHECKDTQLSSSSVKRHARMQELQKNVAKVRLKGLHMLSNVTAVHSILSALVTAKPRSY